MPKPLRLNEQGQIVLTDGPIDLLPYEDRPFIQREFMTDAEIIANAGSDLILDAETIFSSSAKDITHSYIFF